MSLENLPGDARVWVFQSNRLLTENETNVLQNALQNFVADWTAHGKNLTAGFDIVEHAVAIVAIDENAEVPSGCSIDKVFRLLTDFGMKWEIDFFNRTGFVMKQKDKINFYSRAEAEAAFSKGIIDFATETLNTAVSNLDDYYQLPWKPFGATWLGAKLK
jgi:hypothetical protein